MENDEEYHALNKTITEEPASFSGTMRIMLGF